ncbi:hypothetical protein CDIK_2733 [Cucumispora dikerogammari]|nr:hypothetical protein CDIK_2733 [Cucumispora dikerogammari]
MQTEKFETISTSTVKSSIFSLLKPYFKKPAQTDVSNLKDLALPPPFNCTSETERLPATSSENSTVRLLSSVGVNSETDCARQREDFKHKKFDSEYSTFSEPLPKSLGCLYHRRS